MYCGSWVSGGSNVLWEWGRRWFECVVRLERQFLSSSLGPSLISDYFIVIPGRSIDLLRLNIHYSRWCHRYPPPAISCSANASYIRWCHRHPPLPISCSANTSCSRWCHRHPPLTMSCSSNTSYNRWCRRHPPPAISCTLLNSCTDLPFGSHLIVTLH